MQQKMLLDSVAGAGRDGTPIFEVPARTAKMTSGIMLTYLPTTLPNNYELLYYKNDTFCTIKIIHFILILPNSITPLGLSGAIYFTLLPPYQILLNQ